jgi:predicted ribosomally synthesized peptide with nif11-like leader
MAASEIARLRDDAKGSDSLRAALANAGADLDKIVALARSRGYSITREELQGALSTAGGRKGEMSEEDLGHVSGGLVGDFVKGWVT